jgi:hypothetical protein
LDPTNTPTAVATNTPTLVPTDTPTVVPTNSPTLVPTDTPTVIPTSTPTLDPTNTPTVEPTNTATLVPTHTPTVIPTNTPSMTPTNTPTVQPINHAPTNIILSSSTIIETMPIGSLVGSFSTVDPDLGDTFTYILDNSGMGCTGVDNNAFTIVGNNLITNTTFDYSKKSSYTICVKTTDSGGLTYKKQITITILISNISPTLMNTPIPINIYQIDPANDKNRNKPKNTNKSIIFPHNENPHQNNDTPNRSKPSKPYDKTTDPNSNNGIISLIISAFPLSLLNLFYKRVI